ncbi:sporulation peptidase YabG [Fibrobacter succinogenes]|uniref:sporulation peptidase YabG n=1 Tax=Fibrobacter succinogenes TaxID=833 RepID=UPI0013D10F42|nr:sporulation peptidase YabG [Fibrobacter succinogenes]MBQ9297500.1 sporulation peptidase YabG [Clostridia bacterium]
MNFKKGYMVARKSYNKDIIFIIEKIIKKRNRQDYAILNGLTVRIKADAPIEDLEIVSKKEVEEKIKEFEDVIKKRAENLDKTSKKGFKRYKEIIYTGKILHLDGDRRYMEKAIRYYEKLGLKAIVKNVSESKQQYVIKNLLEKYNPDILVITGHDSMLKKGADYNNINNYRNSKYFIESVKEARKYEPDMDKLVIFAGACQSFFEAIMIAGANFASSPGRILIDFVDPLIVAEKVATTDKNKIVTINQIIKEIREGSAGIGGTSAEGKREKILIN